MAIDLNKICVLVVEDNKHMRQLIASVLKSMEVGKVVQAEDGQKALSVVRREKPDIIITDWLMEPMDGLEMTQRIRTDDGNPARLSPIILMTGYSSQARVAEARDMGVTEFLVKPFTAEALAKRISHVINQPRDFIVADVYTGPDRRRRLDNRYAGPRRRTSE